MNFDPMQVLLEKSGIVHMDGKDENGQRFSKNLDQWRIVIAFPGIGTLGKLAEDTDKHAAFDHAISRVETMLRNLRMMKAAHLTTNQNQEP